MTILENVTAGVTLMTGTILPAVTEVFTAEPVVYFVGAGLVMLGVIVIRKLLMPSWY